MQELLSFMAQYNDESKCRQFLFQLRWPHGFVCTYCGNDEYCFIQTRKLYQCMMCRHQVSLTSGTMFHNTKLPVSYWLFVFHWFAVGEACSANKLSDLLQVHYRTALRMMNVVRQTMKAWSGGSTITIGDNRWGMSDEEREETVEKAGSANDFGCESGSEFEFKFVGSVESIEAAGPNRIVNNLPIENRCAVCGAVNGTVADVKIGRSSSTAEEPGVGTKTYAAIDTRVRSDTSAGIEMPVGDAESAESASAACVLIKEKVTGSKTEKGAIGQWKPRLLEAYRSNVVTEALRMARRRARAQISTSYRNVRNWALYFDEHYFRMAAMGRAEDDRAVSLLDIASGCYFSRG